MDTALSDPMVGRVLDGRYRVARRLARGGMATVYEAVDLRLDRTVAVKVMHPALADDEEFVARFIREAKSAARLSQPNVVSVFDQGKDAGAVFLAMEYVEGRTLRDVLRQRGRLSPAESFDILLPLLAALGAAHRAGIVHRDIKPENVLLADDGRVKVADFGLARAVTTTTSATAAAGLLIGTVAYLAPEQVERGIADARSDVYGAGVLLYEMLTGRPPFEGESPIAVAYQHVHSTVPAPSAAAPGTPAEVDALVRRATARDPDERPADAEALRREAMVIARALPARSGGGLVPPSAFDDTLVVPLPRPAAADPAGRAPLAGPPAGPAVLAVAGDAAHEREPAGGASAVGPRRRSRRRAVARVTVLATVLATLLAGGWFFLVGPGAGQPVPGLLTLSQAEAAARAQRAGLRTTTGAAVFDETVPVGHVVRTRPEPGERVRRGGTVTLLLSKGPERYAVPSLAGLTLPRARAALARSNLAAGPAQRRYHDTVAAGLVIASSPPAGASLRRGTVVTLVLSQGVPPVRVPVLVGERLEAAKQALADASLKATIEEAFSDEVHRGRVISQTPAQGNAPKGSAVRLVVSKGPQLFRVPSVRGADVDAARRTLERAGFAVRVQELPGGPNVVLAQSPVAGSMHPRGTRITLAVF